MPENARLTESIGQIDVDVAERKATPRLVMKLRFSSILLGSLSNTVRTIDIFGVEQARPTVHN